MKKCVLIPDSFKGTMSSMTVCSIISGKIKEYYPDCQVVSLPAADGGEGTAEAFLTALHAEKREVTVTGPFGEPVSVYYAKKGKTAIVEMAQAAGLPLAESLGRKDPLHATTYGVGEMITHAIEDGCDHIILGLGGSCTNDCGVGMAAGLGAVFYDENGEAFLPTGETLSKIKHCSLKPMKEKIKDCRFTAMCDIVNPLYGETGAAFVFGPQKGASPEQVLLLDEQLKAVAPLLSEIAGKEIDFLPGAGAAGGMGAGVAAFLQGELKSGIETVLDTVSFEEQILGADLIFTGEGKLDGQSLGGKVISGVAKRAKQKGIPVIAVVGDAADGCEGIFDMGVAAVFSINRLAIPFSQARLRCEKDLEQTIDALMRYQKIWTK